MAESKRRGIYRGHGPAGATAALAANTLEAFDRFEWTLLTLGSVACGLACIWIGSLLGIPREAHFNGSLLLGGSAVPALVAAVIAIGVSMVIGSLVASFVEREAGLFCCCLGLAAFGVRCGSMRAVLQYASGNGAFVSLAVEAILLAVIVIAGWFGIRKALDTVVLKRDTSANHAAPNELTDATVSQKLSTLGVQMLVMVAVELIFIQNDAKPQAMAGVFIAAYAGSIAAYMYTALAEGAWYWAGPMGVAVVGYVLAYMGSAPLLAGEIHGWSAALARATPLDYAGMGTAGALLGYWSSRRWAQPEAATDEDETPVTA